MLKVVRSWQSGSLGAIVRSAGRSRRGAIAGGRRLNSSSPSDIMALEPADRLQCLGKNVWVEFSALAAETNPVNLGQGFPDFPPPDFVTDALVQPSMVTSLAQYTRSQGHPRLVKALAKLYGILHGREINPMTEIIITLGAYSSLSHITRSFLQKGDEAILIEPYFDCYAPMVMMSDATPVFIPLRPQGKFPGSSRDWSLDPQELEAAFSPRTKMIIVNSPHNPFGKIFTRSELEMVADLCKKHDVMCISDEVYEWLVYKGNEHVRIATLPGMWERTITISSAGKAFSATGWKTGWSVGPEHLIKHLQAVNGQSGFTMITPIQEALAVGVELETSRLGQPDSYFRQLPELLEKKRDEFAAVLREVGFEPIVPDGGYFIMADTSSVGFQYDPNDEDNYDFQFAKWMMREKGVGCIPPSAFYSPQHAHISDKLIRFCFCKKDETLQEAYKKLRHWAEERKANLEK